MLWMFALVPRTKQALPNYRRLVKVRMHDFWEHFGQTFFFFFLRGFWLRTREQSPQELGTPGDKDPAKWKFLEPSRTVCSCCGSKSFFASVKFSWEALFMPGSFLTVHACDAKSEAKDAHAFFPAKFLEFRLFFTQRWNLSHPNHPSIPESEKLFPFDWIYCCWYQIFLMPALLIPKSKLILHEKSNWRIFLISFSCSYRSSFACSVHSDVSFSLQS